MLEAEVDAEAEGAAGGGGVKIGEGAVVGVGWEDVNMRRRGYCCLLKCWWGDVQVTSVSLVVGIGCDPSKMRELI